jgi:hypothetical protein
MCKQCPATCGGTLFTNAHECILALGLDNLMEGLFLALVTYYTFTVGYDLVTYYTFTVGFT